MLPTQSVELDLQKILAFCIDSNLSCTKHEFWIDLVNQFVHIIQLGNLLYFELRRISDIVPNCVFWRLTA